MSADDDPQPSTSSGVTRSETTAPLNEQEYKFLMENVGTNFGGVGVGDSTLEGFEGPGLGDTWQQTAAESSLIANQIGREDTLDRNPGFVNPQDVTHIQNHHEPQANPNMTIDNGQLQFIMDSVDTATTGVPKPDPHTPTPESGQFIEIVQMNPNMVEWTVDPVQAGTGIEPSSPTGMSPAVSAWPGMADFKANFMRLSDNPKHETWEHSKEMNKLYINMGHKVKVGFTAVNISYEGLFIRAMPVYADPSFFTEPVRRCPNHASPTDSTNANIPEHVRDHLVRVSHNAARYETDPKSNRLSVVVPFEKPQGGTHYCGHLYEFMCLNSDVGGINRKPVKLIYTLEQGDGSVIGRWVVGLRTCSCPKRDKKQDEVKYAKERAKALGHADSLARSNSVFSKPTGKKRKANEIEEFVMVPVAQADYEKINEFAEAAVLVRNPGKEREIKEQRRRLTDQHNKELANKRYMSKKPPS